MEEIVSARLAGPKQTTLEDVAKQIFHDTASAEAVEEPFKNHGKLLDDFPLSVQRFIWRARERFYHSGDDDFKLNIEMNPLTIEEKDQLTKDDLDVLRPVFATAYLKRAGIKDTAESVRMVEKLVPITLDNIELNTQRKGFYTDNLVVSQYLREHAVGRRARANLSAVCDEIRRQMRSCWASVDRSFPRERREPLPRPYQASETFITQAALLRMKPITDRHPATITTTKTLRRTQPRSPFTDEWPLTLPRDDIDKIVFGFVRAFDFFTFFRGEIAIAKDCVAFLRNGLCPRILFHVVKYLHSLFVMDQDDLPNYVRLRALWYTCCKTCDSSIVSYKFMSTALMMIKACAYVVFDEQGQENVGDRPLLQSTIFHAVDQLLNLYEVFDSFEKEENYRVKLPQVNLPRGQTLLSDIQEFVDKGLLSDREELLARHLLNPSGSRDLMFILGSESWGDAVEKEIEGKQRTYNERRMTQKMLERDIAEINRVMPRDPPEWISSRDKTPRAQTHRAVRGMPLYRSRLNGELSIPSQPEVNDCL